MPGRARADDGHRLPALAARCGGWGTTQPSSQARLMIEFSICLIVTASPSRISSTQAASHGAGHSRPVNSGKLLVACSWRDRVLEAVAVDEVVPVGDQVAERAAVVAEGHAAVHAAGALLAQLLDRPLQLELAVVVRRAQPGPAVGCPWRSICRKPPSLPIRRRPPPTASSGRSRRQRRRWRAARRERLLLGPFAQHALVVVGHHLHEGAAADQLLPLAPSTPRGDRRVGALLVLLDHRPQLDRVGLGEGSRSRPCPCCSALAKAPVLVEHVGDAAAHARRRSCARSARARRRGRRSCTRSRGRRRPPRPSTRPELRTAKRSPASPRKKARPAVAP